MSKKLEWNQKVGNNTDIPLEEMQRQQLKLLKELDRVCKENNLHYVLSSGSVLGAIRHGGFIPWDDDIDCYMSWKDALKLVKLQDKFSENYFVQSYETDPDFPSTHYRLCDSNTSCFMEESKGLNINHGIFLDIYIYYPYPDKPGVQKKITFDSVIYRTLVAKRPPQNHGKAIALLGNMILLLYSGNRRKKKIKDIEKLYRHNGGKNYVATYFGRDIGLNYCITYPREWFVHPKMMKFEDMMVPVPGNPEEYCRKQYGDDFMTPPPKEKQFTHHDFIYCSTTEPYTNYKGVYY